MWSITGYKQFKRCQRQWYYKNIVADARVKNDPFRKEVTILSKLQTLEAWRGKIVDDIISGLLVNAINNKTPIKKEFFLSEAMSSFDRQYEYAIFQKYRQPEAKLSDKDFAAFLNYEFGDQIIEQEAENARNDVNEALSNLLDNTEFIEYLKSAKFLASQKSLKYYYDRFSINAIPDLIAFFDNKPPHIFDWKVHTYGTNSYDDQLISYAVALYKVSRTKPHIYFPQNTSEYSIYDYKISEYQLLHKDRIKRDYEITEEGLEDFSNMVSGSIIEMYMSGSNKKYADSDPENFSTTHYIENCRSCPFKKICKQTDNEIRKQHLQN